ncbi:uncharacterized protein LOC135495843 [Lineus longissimus]|uniref:uncharacterized protein LOC135495843 n=1 Tax=Lineus longissimus TaxID=88925 RepID=UPI002B4F9FA3
MAAPVKGVSVIFEENLAIICWNCGENRLNPTAVAGLNDALDRIERNPDVSAVVTTGHGRFFSNGLDLDYMASLDDKTRNKFYYAVTSLICRFITFPVPTVAAINGHAFAGGCFLALAHDYIVMQTDKGWMSANEVFLGLRIGDFFTALYRAKVADPSVRRDLIIFGKRFTAQMAKDVGLVTRTCKSESLMTETKRLASEAAEAGYERDNIRGMKVDMYQSVLDKRLKMDEHGPLSKL